MNRLNMKKSLIMELTWFSPELCLRHNSEERINV